MIQRDFYECRTLTDANDLVSHILANTDELSWASEWSNVLSYDDGQNPIVYYVKIHRSYPTFKEYTPPSGNKISIVKLNTRTGSEEGSQTTFRHYPMFDERVGVDKTQGMP